MKSRLKVSSTILRLSAGPVMALFVCCLLIAMGPFSTALAVHHELAAADADGHEHSDTDLCQWVQYHTSGSSDAAPPTVSLVEVASQSLPHIDSVPLSIDRPCAGPSRAPPRF